MRTNHWMLGALLIAASLTSCGPGEDESTPPGDAGAGAKPAETSAAVAMSTPRGSIEYQLGLLEAEDTEALKACFTERQRARITAEAVAEGAKEAGTMTLAAIYASEEAGEFEGNKTMKVKMENGRTLTTLVLTDGVWLADTVWFR